MAITEDSVGQAMHLPESNAHKLMCWLVALGIAVFYVSALVLDGYDSIVLALLVIVGTSLWMFDRPRDQLPPETKLFFFVVSFFLLAAVLAWWCGGQSEYGERTLGRYLRFMGVIPLWLLLTRYPLPKKVFWWVLSLGAAVSGLWAVYESQILVTRVDKYLVSGATHHILYGNLSLMMSAMAMAGYVLVRRQPPWANVLYLSGPLLGLIAMVLSGSRGAWLALPAVGIVLCWTYLKAYGKKSFVLLLAGLLALMAIAYAVPKTGVAKRIHNAHQQFSQYFASEGKHAGTSIGSRFEMWRVAIDAYQNHPLIGIGTGNYRYYAKQLAVDDVVHSAAANYSHPHNEYLSVAATRGTLGLIALTCLFGVPLYLFWRIGQRKDDALLAYGMAGVILVVGYASFGLTEAIFDRTLPISFYSLTCVCLLCGIQLREKERLGQPSIRNKTLTATIIAKNEGDRIRRCLDSVVNWADEIIVLDSGSTDDTVAIAREYTDQVFVTDWPGYGPQKQRALEKSTSEWVLSIDADEAVTPELKAAIDEALADASLKAVGFRLPWAVTIYGRRLDFGRSGRAPLRLFQRAGAKFTDAAVHETVELPAGQIHTLTGRLLHFTHRDYRHALGKSVDYACLKAEEKAARGKRGNVPYAVLRAGWDFFVIYVVRLGFLDGQHGMLMAGMYAQYAFNKYAGLWTLNQVVKFKEPS